MLSKKGLQRIDLGDSYTYGLPEVEIKPKKYKDGGEVGEDDFMKQFGKQVSYKPEETSWWSDVKNWWNDLTGMKNYAYGNCATTPGGKHTKECAHYSNSILRNQGYKNIVGDAWTRAANSGMKKITSGYDGLTKPIEWNENDAHEYLQSAAENFASKIDTTGLKPYDVIGLYYPDSPNTKKAFEQGRWGETQTHTGHTVIGKDGTHYVVHNVNGHLKINKLADMLTGDYEYKPVSAYRPKKYADGGEVEPNKYSERPIINMNPETGEVTYGYNPAAGYLSGTDPIGEAMMWGLGGGAASAALRSLFPTYGATAAWLAFGGNDKDNMLVVPNNLAKNKTPIETGLLNKEVRQYYADDVLPRDILTSEADKLRFLNTDKNFEYDLYPQAYFSNGVAGHYDRLDDKIRLNGGYTANKDLLDNVMAHEVNHRYNREFPLDKEHNRILNRAYTIEPDLDTPAARAARKPSEKRATNVNIRHKLQTDLRNTLGRKPTKAEMDEFIDSLSDQELLDRLGSASSYGSAYLMSIEDRAELANQPADQYKKARVTGLRKALKRIAMNENKNDNNQNYA